MPTGEFVTPAEDEAVFGTIPIEVTAEQEGGVINVVMFYVDPSPSDIGFAFEPAWIANDISDPYTVMWDTTEVANGTHTLAALISSPTGGTITIYRTITVANGVRKVQWDKVGERRYETGVDRGVLYPPNGDAVPWNGLVSVSDDMDHEVKEYFLDGVKYLEYRTPNNFSGKIQAITFPDELDSLVGISEYSPGVFLHDQKLKPFGLSFRTLLGNDVDGLDHGYRLHILYNVLASPSSRQYTTVSASTTPMVFEWDISATPPIMGGARPTAHISFDSTSIDPAVLETIENLLYGIEATDPRLPTIAEIMEIVSPTPSAGALGVVAIVGQGPTDESGIWAIDPSTPHEMLLVEADRYMLSQSNAEGTKFIAAGLAPGPDYKKAYVGDEAGLELVYEFGKQILADGLMWGRDSNKIYACLTDRDIWVAELDGTSASLVKAGADWSMFAGETNDGHILYVDFTQTNLVKLNLTTGVETVIVTGDEDWLRSATLSPDGTFLATEQKAAAHSDIVVYYMTGSTVTMGLGIGATLKATGLLLPHIQRAWSPDSRYLLAVRSDEDTFEDPEVIVIDMLDPVENGSVIAQLSGEFYSNLCWAYPSGDWIYLTHGAGPVPDEYYAPADLSSLTQLIDNDVDLTPPQSINTGNVAWIKSL